MSDRDSVDRPLRSVFIGNIPYEVTEEKLREIFSEVGPVLNMKLVYDRESGKPKGYGFCEYKDVDTALSAMRNLNGYEINGRTLRVDNAGAERHRMSEAMGGVGPGNGPSRMMDESTSHMFMRPPQQEMMMMRDREREEMSQHPPPPEKSTEVISKAVSSLPPEQMCELMKQMKLCIQNNPNEARTMLLQNPQLAYALLQALVVMKIVDPAQALTLLHQDNGVPVGTLMPEGQTGGMMMGNQKPSRFGPAPENPWITQTGVPVNAPLMPLNPPGSFGAPPQMIQPTQGSDMDFRQLDPRIRQNQDMDLRGTGGDPRNQDRFGGGMDPRHHRGDRDDRDRDVRGSSSRGDRDLRDPRQSQSQTQQVSDPRARARAEREQQSSASAAAPKIPASALPPGFGAGTSDTEKAALIMQVLQLSDEQIAMLPPEQRQSILVLKEQIAKANR